jgi:outer membrane protein assembly factor BamB
VALDHQPPVGLEGPLGATFVLPRATEFPVDHLLSWEVADVAGNRAAGGVPITFTHERAVERLQVPVPGPTIVPGPGGRVFVAGGGRLFALDATAPAWDLDTGWTVGQLVALADGGVLVALFDADRLPGAFVRRLGPDGATVYETPNLDASSYADVSLATSGEVLAVRCELAPEPARCAIVRIGTDGAEAVLAALPDGWIARHLARVEADPEGSFAVWLDDTTGASAPRVAVHDSGGAERWSTPLPAGSEDLRAFWPLRPDRIALAFADPDTGVVTIRAFGPAGEVWSRPEASGEELQAALVRGGLLWTLSEFDHARSAICQFSADGAVFFERVFDDSIRSFDLNDDGALIHFGGSLLRLRPDGSERWRSDLPAGDEASSLSAAALASDGNVWAVAPGRGFPSRLFHLDATGTVTFLQRFDAGPPMPLVASPDDGGVAIPVVVTGGDAGDVTLDLRRFVP